MMGLMTSVNADFLVRSTGRPSVSYLEDEEDEPCPLCGIVHVPGDCDAEEEDDDDDTEGQA